MHILWKNRMIIKEKIKRYKIKSEMAKLPCIVCSRLKVIRDCWNKKKIMPSYTPFPILETLNNLQNFRCNRISIPCCLIKRPLTQVNLPWSSRATYKLQNCTYRNGQQVNSSGGFGICVMSSVPGEFDT